MKKIILFFCLLTSLSVAHSQSAADIQAYIARFRNIAIQHEQKYGIPATITLAQGILESGAGKSALARNSGNHFGIKALGGWKGRVYKAWDDEVVKSSFRCYNTPEESFEDHARVLLNGSRYRSLFALSLYDYRGWANGLQRAGYATAQTYAVGLIGLIEAYRLYAINGGVKLKAGRTVTIVRYITKEKPVFSDDCQLSDEETTDEEQQFREAVNRYLVEVNDVRCTVLLPGETISSLSQRYDLSKKKILEYNEVLSEKELKDGDIVFLAKKKSKYTGAQDFYRAKADDTLFGVSQRFGIKVSSLAKMNGKNQFSRLKEGERLRLK